MEILQGKTMSRWVNFPSFELSSTRCSLCASEGICNLSAPCCAAAVAAIDPNGNYLFICHQIMVIYRQCTMVDRLKWRTNRKATAAASDHRTCGVGLIGWLRKARFIRGFPLGGVNRAIFMYLGRLIEVLIFSASHVFELSTLYTSGGVKKKGHY